MPELTRLPLSVIELLEDNPRTIDKEEFAKLCIDIRDDPAYFEQRPPLINYLNGRYICYAGNQRVRAAEYLGMEQVPAFVEENVPFAVQQKRTILDNTHRGQWDYAALANSWQHLPIRDWGVDISKEWTKEQPQWQEGSTEIEQNLHTSDENPETEVYKIEVIVESAEKQQSLLSELKERGFTAIEV